MPCALVGVRARLATGPAFPIPTSSAGKRLTMRQWIAAFLLAAGPSACAAEEPAEPAELDYAHRLSYSPDEELAQATATALGVIRGASGLPLTVSDENATTVSVAEPETLFWCDENGECGHSCAQTLVTYTGDYERIVGVEILVAWPQPDSCMSLPRTIMHEVIHSVLRDAESVGHSLHTDRGVFQLKANSKDNRLESESLTALCSHSECTRFAPEQ
jgi:hypothetical protein